MEVGAIRSVGGRSGARASPGTARPPTYSFRNRGPDALQVRVERFDRDHVNTRIGPHRHSFLEFFQIERGEGFHRVDGERLGAAPGDLFLVAPGEVHDARGLAGAAGWVTIFMPDAVGPARPEAGSFFGWATSPMLLPFLRPAGFRTGRASVPIGERDRWSEMFGRMRSELLTRRAGRREVVRSLLTIALVEAARLRTEAEGAPVPEEDPLAEDPLVAAVFAVVEARFAEPISLADVAREVGRSPAHLTTLVRRSTGRTVLGWITERRMFEARRLLLETDRNVAEVARRVGYGDPTHFARLFRRAHGTPPTAWRRAALG